MEADAIVIGAGAAGLAAARSLAERSLRVVLLEARDRIGGRVWSRYVPHLTTPAELGAEFIHGQARETMSLLREAGIATVSRGGDSWMCAKGGELRRDDKDFTLAARALEKAHSLAKDESADKFLQRLESDEGTRRAAEAARAFVQGFEAADPAIASVQSIADELRTGVDSRTARPVGGYQPMFELLHKACAVAGVRMCLSTTVTRISWRRGTVAVDTCNGSRESSTTRARAAIVTFPIGVLRHRGDETAIAFDPGLPGAKHEAIQNIEMGQAVKVMLWFRSAFWEQVRNGRYRDAAAFRCEGQPFATYWTQFPVRSTLIVAWAGGPKAIALQNVSETDLIERALNGFGAAFKEPTLARNAFVGGIMHDWGRDRFARGAYSYVAVGGGNARAVLAAPVDSTLFFAGEATSYDGQGGTVNGALESGERAAGEAAAELCARTG